ncbi:unnamed protein product [Caenorhabditis bovis]|uniref:Uncharacterized protein n=1 Tax=Caenorhabditis bovis TaxID=2654633 RepID=A0A8S1EJU8_9PELO|nr:unnamed protein product [Caenorhabditis bovis]
MSKVNKSSKAGPKLTLASIESIPGQIGFIVCKGNQIVHNTIPKSENPLQIAFNGMKLAARTKGAEFEGHEPHTIQVQFNRFMFEMFQAGPYFIIVKKRIDDNDA